MKVSFRRKYQEMQANGRIDTNEVWIEINTTEDNTGIVLRPEENAILAELQGKSVGHRPTDI
jgi:hypothetical protein